MTLAGVDRVVGFRAAEVRHLVLPLAGLAQPVRVVQLTDLHFGMVTPDALIARAVDTANRSAPDVVALTGDFVCRGNRWIGRITDVLSALHAPAVAVLGNHDHFVAADAVTRALERAGVEVLRNRSVCLPVRGRSFWIAGMDDGTTGHDDADATVAGLDGPALGLTHNPRDAPKLWALGVRGVLSGHTHAGQFHVRRLTRRLYGRVLRQPYVDGLYEEEGGWVYVSAGVGSSALPWRTGTPARREVSVVDLAAPAG